MSKLKLRQKVTVRDGFYAPVNGVIAKVEVSLERSMFPAFPSGFITFKDYIFRSKEYTTYAVAYEQRVGDRCSVNLKEFKEADIQTGWHGMKCNGDDSEFAKFGIKEINGRVIAPPKEGIQ